MEQDEVDHVLMDDIADGPAGVDLLTRQELLQLPDVHRDLGHDLWLSGRRRASVLGGDVAPWRIPQLLKVSGDRHQVGLDLQVHLSVQVGLHHQEGGEVLHLVHNALHGLQRRKVDAHIKVLHAGFLELVPESSRNHVDGNVVSDDSADAGQGGLDGTQGGQRSPLSFIHTRASLTSETISRSLRSQSRVQSQILGPAASQNLCPSEPRETD